MTEDSELATTEGEDSGASRRTDRSPSTLPPPAFPPGSPRRQPRERQLGVGVEAAVTELAGGGDPHVLELTERIETLARSLKEQGGAGLRVEPDMDRFDSTLRGYCAGYLVGRREGEGR